MIPTSQENQIQRLLYLFQGNSRVIGQTSADLRLEPGSTDKLKQSKVGWGNGPVTKQHWKEHLEGKTGLGIVPITDYQEAKFMALDVDLHFLNHLKLSLGGIAALVEEHKLPFVVCRSKSGAAHLYVFFDRLTEVATVLKKLSEIADGLGLRDGKGDLAEIFPHTAQLDPNSNGKFINMPYFNSDETRAAVDKEGKPLSLDEFLALAEARTITAAKFLKIQLPVHGEKIIRELVNNGPPCLATLFESGLTEGSRNDMLFQFGIMFKKAVGKQFEALVEWVNLNRVDKPLPIPELGLLMKGIRSKDYHFSCNHPCMSPLCAKSLCQGRKYGISSGFEFPTVKKVLQWGSNTENFEIHFDDAGNSVLLISATDLLDFNKVQAQVLRLFHKVIEKPRGNAWAMHVTTLMTKVIREIVPTEFSTESQIKSLILAYANSRSIGTKPEDLLVRKPVRQGDFVLISYKDLQAEIQRRRFFDYTEGLELPVILNELKGSFEAITVGKEKIGVVKLPFVESGTKEMLEKIGTSFKEVY